MRMRVLAALLSASAVLSACGQSEPAAQVPGPPPPISEVPTAVPPPPAPIELDSSPTIADIKQRGKMIVGLRSNEPKFVTRGGAGDYRGFDVEIARMLASGIGLDAGNGITFRWLPPTLVGDAMSGGNVDVQIGGFDPANPRMSKVGPYVVTGSAGAEEQQFLGIPPGDEAMRKEFQRVLDEAVANGSWQRAYDATLGTTGVQARPIPG